MSLSRLVACGLIAALAAPLFAAEPAPAKAAVKAAAAAPAGNPAVQKIATAAIDYLRTKGQAADGSFSAQAGPGVTAIVLAGALANGRSPDEPWIQKGLKYVEGFVEADGGLNKPNTNNRNYETSLAILAFAEANKDGRYSSLLKKLDKFVRDNQWGGADGKTKSDVEYGGAGYGRSKRPDLSNTQFFLDAIKAAGAGPDDEAVKRALIFVSRCQNLESEHNTTPFPAKNPDNGFYYTPAGGGSSPPGNTANGGLRSYASMTYAGLKSMIYAGVSADDPRVKAAVTWIQKNYDLKSNPGMEQAGLFYYYQTFAKALNALKMDKIKDAKGVEHDWRAELIAELTARQKPDGSFVNDEKRWMESDANLVTGYALLALAQLK